MGLYAREHAEVRLANASELEWQDPSLRFDPLNKDRVVFDCRYDCGFLYCGRAVLNKMQGIDLVQLK